MQNNQISCVYYPTTVLLVDDSERFLNHIALMLGERLPYNLLTDPVQALDILRKNNLFSTLSSKLISTDLESDDYGTFAERFPVSLNISTLYHTIYDPVRFSQISVAVVDYAMPKMSGLEFCEKLRGMAVKKIMLTGQADEIIAVNAFNDGLIDKFIVKSQPKVGKSLTDSIHQLQKRSFQELSEVVIKGLASEPNSYISNSRFVNFFDKLCQDLHIVEYYLIDVSGSFLLLDEDGLPIWFIIKSEEDMEDLTMQAVDTNAPADVIEALSKREKIAYFNKLHDYVHTVGDKWKSVLYPATNLEGLGNKSYFYCIIKDLPTFGLEAGKIDTLRNYTEKSYGSAVYF